MVDQTMFQFPVLTPNVLKAYKKLGHLRAGLDLFWRQHQQSLVAEPSSEDGYIDEDDGMFVPEDIEHLSWAELHDLWKYYEELKEIVEVQIDELDHILDAKKESQKKS